MAREQRTVLKLRAGPWSASDLLVTTLSGSEALSEPYVFRVAFRLRSGEPLDLRALLGAEALLTLQRDDAERFVHGVVSAAALETMDLGVPRYRVELSPRLALLAHRAGSRIFQGQPVPRIVATILDEQRIDHRLDLTGAAPVREYCTQHRETDLAFVERLLAEEGIFYWFECSETRHVLVLSDDVRGLPEVARDPALPWRPFGPEGGAAAAGDEHVFALERVRRIRPDRLTLRDFDWEHPGVDLTAAAGKGALEAYEHPGGYAVGGDGLRTAALRLERWRVDADALDGASTCLRLAPGRRFEIRDHPDPGTGRLVVRAVVHEAAQPEEAAARGGLDADYRNRFLALPDGVPFRPPARRRPRAPSVETGVVVGPSGEEIHDDRHGRVKVAMRWDRSGRCDDGASAWIRVAQRWAGPGAGASYVPRLGQEVAIRFLDGDPDRPLVVGAVYDGRAPPPVELPADKTRSTLRSSSSPGSSGANELRLEDRAGAEELHLHAQHDLRLEVEGDKAQRVGGAERLLVEGDRTRAVGGDQRLEVARDDEACVRGGQTLTIAGVRGVAVGGAHVETILGSQAVTVRGEQGVFVTGAGLSTVGGVAALTVGGAYAVAVGGVVNEAVAGARAVEVGAARAELVLGTRAETIGGDLDGRCGGDHEIDVQGELATSTGQDQEETIAQDLALSTPEAARWTAKRIALVATDELRVVVGGNLLATVRKSGEITLAVKALTVETSGAIELQGQKIQKDAADALASASAQVRRLEALKNAAAVFAFELTDEQGNPVAGQPFAVELPDGTVARGVTDAQGQGKVPGAEPGTAKLRLTRLDAGAVKA